MDVNIDKYKKNIVECIKEYGVKDTGIDETVIKRILKINKNIEAEFNTAFVELYDSKIIDVIPVSLCTSCRTDNILNDTENAVLCKRCGTFYIQSECEDRVILSNDGHNTEKVKEG